MQMPVVVIATVLLLIVQFSPTLGSLTAIATFSQNGISGTITFAQNSSSSPTSIHVNLTGLSTEELYQWHVHQYPFTAALPSPCSPANVGGHYDPLGASTNNNNYKADCAMNKTICEIGDLSGKFGLLNTSLLPLNINDSSLSLYGYQSIIGRSVVLHLQNGTRYVCANIDVSQPSNITEIEYVPFRALSIFGNIYFTEYNFGTTSVFVDLFSANPTVRHDWHVHNYSVQHGDTNGCSSTGGHYNPRNVDVKNYSLCNGANPLACEVGDLSGKGGQISFSGTQGRLLYTDTDLPITAAPNRISIIDRSVVIHQANGGAPRIACGNLTRLQSKMAAAIFNGEEGVSGTITFRQNSPYEPTTVIVNINGLQGMAGGYHVHETPVGEGNLSGREQCAPIYTGGHWNPRGVSYLNGIPPDNGTNDQYEVGDLSSKYGSLDGLPNINEEYSDSDLPLFGKDSIIGRSVVIHFAKNNSRWVCADINHSPPIVQTSSLFSIYGHTIQVLLVQPADDPFAETTIIIKNITSFVTPSVTSSSSSTLASSTSMLVSLSTSELLSPSPSASSILSSSFIQSPSDILSPSLSLSSMLSSSLVQSSSPSDTLSPSPSFSSMLSSSFVQVSLTSYTLSPSSSTYFTPLPFTTTLSPFSSLSLSPSSLMDDGSGDMKRRRRDTDEESIEDYLIPEVDYNYGWENDAPVIVERQITTETIKLSIRDVPQQPITYCELLSISLAAPSENYDLCQAGNQLACSGGDLLSKHGALSISATTGIRKVFTDSYLPLSGPDSVVNKVLLLETQDGSQTNQFAFIQANVPPVLDVSTCSISPTTSSIPTMSSSVTAPPISDTNLPLPLPYFIAVVAGGGVLLMLLILFLIICIACCVWKNRKSKSYKKYLMKDNLKDTHRNVELGLYKRSNPIFGVTTYKALFNYEPQQPDDLKLQEGDMVMLIEAPPGGEWWRGKVDNREGWFPKSYVNYIDIIAEEKKRKDESFAAAAATIRVASIAFQYDTAASTPTVSKKIDSTPLLVTKFDDPNRSEIETAFIVANVNTQTPDASPNVKRSTTPLLDDRALSPIDNNGSRTPTPPLHSPLPSDDIYIAQYNYYPQADSELQLQKGNEVIVIEKTDTGWWHGVVGEDHGWFPETFVKQTDKKAEEKMKDEENIELKKDEFRPRGMTEFHKGTSEEVEAMEYKAIFSYISEAEGDLQFYEGDSILVYWANPSGWWYGAAGGNQGYFPGSYVEPIMEVSEASSSVASPIPPDEDQSPLEEQAISLTNVPAIEGTPVHLGSSSLNDEIAAALKKRQNKESVKIEQEIRVEVPANEGGSISLNDEIAAALKKKQDKESIKTDSEIKTEVPYISSSPIAGDLQSDIMSVLNSFGSSKINDPSLLSDEHDDEIITATADQLSEENSIEKESKPVEVAKNSSSIKPRRHAPPPPSGRSSGRSSTSSRSPLPKSPSPLLSSMSPKPPEGLTAADIVVPNQLDDMTPRESPQSLESPKETPVENEVSKTETYEEATITSEQQPIPSTAEVAETKLTKESPEFPKKSQKENQASETGLTNQPNIKREEIRSGAPKVVKTLKTSPSTRPRRVPPPPPPSSLSTHTKTAITEDNNTPLKAPQTLTMPTSLTQKPNTSTKNNQTSLNHPPLTVTMPTNTSIKNNHTSTLSQGSESKSVKRPESRVAYGDTGSGGGWKPQVKKSRRPTAPRRLPPNPPPGSPQVIQKSQPKPKMTKIKRPSHRNIPPPPNIPLPPPPNIPLPPPPVKTKDIPPEPTFPPPSLNAIPAAAQQPSSVEPESEIPLPPDSEPGTITPPINSSTNISAKKTDKKDLKSQNDDKISALEHHNYGDDNKDTVITNSLMTFDTTEPKGTQPHPPKIEKQTQPLSLNPLDTMEPSNTQKVVETNKSEPQPPKMIATEEPITKEVQSHSPSTTNTPTTPNVQMEEIKPVDKPVRPVSQKSSIPNKPPPHVLAGANTKKKVPSTEKPLLKPKPKIKLNKIKQINPEKPEVGGVTVSELNPPLQNNVLQEETSQVKEPVPNQQSTQPDETSQVKEPVPKPRSAQPDETSQVKEPVPKPRSVQPDETSQVKEPVPKPRSAQPDETSQVKEPVPKPRSAQPDETSQVKEPVPKPRSAQSDETSQMKVSVTKPRPPPPVRTSSLSSTPQGSPAPSPDPVQRSNVILPSPPTSDDPPVTTQKKVAPPPRPKPPPTLAVKASTLTNGDSSKVEHKKDNPNHHDNQTEIDYPVPKSRRKSRDSKKVPPSRPPPPRAHSIDEGNVPAPRSNLDNVSASSDDRSLSASPTNKLYRATKTYVANGNNKLSFNNGDTLIVIDGQPTSDEEGYVYGMLDDGKTGLFPLSHVEEYIPNES